MVLLKELLPPSRKTGAGKKLRVFDFDDTLAKVDSWVYIKQPNGKEKKLDSAEYAVYKLKPGETEDFRDFNKMLRDPKIIKKNVEMLRNQLDKARKASRGARKVTILTARALGYPIRKFFKTLGMNVYIVAVGSSDPEKKADWIEAQVKKGYTDVAFMDDSAKNIRAVKRRLQKYPNVKLIAKLVD